MKSLRVAVLRALSVAVLIQTPDNAMADETYAKTIPVQSTPVVSAPEAINKTDWWPSIGFGAYGAQDYKGGPDATHDGTHVGGAEGSIAFTYAWTDTGILVRLRGSAYTTFTSNVAKEAALMGGVPLLDSRQLWVNAGISRLVNVSNAKDTPTIGVPLELLFYPLSGLELAVHTNINGDRTFFGFSVSWAIARRRVNR